MIAHPPERRCFLCIREGDLLLLDLVHCNKRLDNLGLACEFLRSFFRANGEDAHIHYSTGDIDEDLAACADHAEIMVSLFYTYSYRYFKRLATFLEGKRVVVGGPFASYLRFLQDVPVSIVFREFGELMISEEFSLEKRVLDLSPQVVRLFEGCKELTISYPLSYGCYWGGCHFCDSREHAPNFLETPVEVAMRHIRHAQSVLSDKELTIFFVGDAIRSAQLLAVSSEMARVGLPWIAYVRADANLRDPTVINAMARGGCKRVLIGVEVLDNTAYKLMNKGYSAARVKRTISELGSGGIEVKAFLFTHLPGANRAVFKSSLENLLEVSDSITEAEVDRFHLFKTSTFYKNSSRFPIEVTHDRGYWVNWEPTHCTIEEWEKINAEYLEGLQAIFGDKLRIA